MRKGHEKILQQAENAGISEPVMEMLKNEAYTLSELDDILDFSTHFREFDGNIDIYFETCRFLSEIETLYYKLCSNATIRRAGFRAVYRLFPAARLGEILELKENYSSGTYTASDIKGIIDITAGYGENRISFADVIEIISKRKRMEEHGECSFYPLDMVAACIYKNNVFRKLSVQDLFRIDCAAVEKGFLSPMQESDEIKCLGDGCGGQKPACRGACKDDNPSEKIADSVRKYIIQKKYPGMYELLFNENAEISHTPASMYESCLYFWETEKVDAINRLMDEIPETDITISGSPYRIDACLTCTGISISCAIYKKYFGCNRGNGEKTLAMRDKGHPQKLLLTFDGRCFMEIKGGWKPMSLTNLSFMYRMNDTMKEVIGIWMKAMADEGSYIWKDIPEYLESGLVPPIKIDSMRGIRTKNELMLSYYSNSEFYNWNRGNLFYGYIAMKAMRYVDERDYPILMNYIRCVSAEQALDTAEDGIATKYEGYIMLFLKKLIISRIKDFDKSRQSEILICDYIRMSQAAKRKITLRARSIKRVKLMHDDVSVALKLKGMSRIKNPKNSVFKKLRKLLPDEFEWIRSSKRLAVEADTMHHCVASYAEEINKDRSAIYSFIYGGDGKRYTIEFRADRGGGYSIRQIHGKFNSVAPKEVVKYVKGFIS